MAGISDEGFGLREVRWAPYANATTGTVGTFIALDRRTTATYDPDINTITNEYNGGVGAQISQLTGGTVTIGAGGFPLEFFAATQGLTIVTTGTTPSAVDTLDIPLNRTTEPPLGVLEYRQLTPKTGGDQVERLEGVRFQPIPTLGAVHNEWRNTELVATVEGNSDVNKLARIQQRESAATLV